MRSSTGGIDCRCVSALSYRQGLWTHGAAVRVYPRGRVQVKRRLFRANRDFLGSVREHERKQRLATLYSAEESNYLSLLRSAGVPLPHMAATPGNTPGTPSQQAGASRDASEARTPRL